MQLLERRFGKEIAVERFHLSEVLKVKPVTDENNVRGLRAFYDKVETHYQRLCALKANKIRTLIPRSYPIEVHPLFKKLTMIVCFLSGKN